MAKVSIIVPIYRVSTYLEKCVKSICQQTFQDIELILVDDGSDDCCAELCDIFAQEAELSSIDIHVIHQKNGGLSAARNIGIEWVMNCSDSEWIAFVDSDDYISDEYIQKLHDLAISSNADLAICDFFMVDSEEHNLDEPHCLPEEVIDHQPEKAFQTLYYQWRIHPAWNKLYHKELFQSIRFRVGRLHEDEFIIHEILAKSGRIVLTSLPLYYYLIRSTGIMGGENRRTKKDGFTADIERYWFCKENGLPLDPRMLSVEYMIDICEFNDVQLLEKYKNAFFDAPFNRNIKARMRCRFWRFYKWYRKRKLENG